MEDFKRVIQRRNFILKCLILLAVILDIVLNIIPIDPQLDIATSFQIGLLIGLSLLGCIGVYKYSRILKDDNELEKLEISEHDERKKMIKQKTSQSTLITVVITLLMVTCVIIYFNQLIAFTLLCVIYSILLITIAFKIYYSKKY